MTKPETASAAFNTQDATRALALLDQVAGMAPVTRQDHVAVQNAVALLARVLEDKGQPSPEPATPEAG